MSTRRAAGSTSSRLIEFRERLTVVHQPASSSPFRVVRSSGGAAGGVVTEGQGYGLLLAGVALAGQSIGSPGWRSTLSFGEELFAGWRRMCELSTNSCQDEPRLRCHPSGPTMPRFAARAASAVVSSSDRVSGIARVLQHTQDCARTAIGTPDRTPSSRA